MLAELTLGIKDQLFFNLLFQCLHGRLFFLVEVDKLARLAFVKLGNLDKHLFK